MRPSHSLDLGEKRGAKAVAHIVGRRHGWCWVLSLTRIGRTPAAAALSLSIAGSGGGRKRWWWCRACARRPIAVAGWLGAGPPAAATSLCSALGRKNETLGFPPPRFRCFMPCPSKPPVRSIERSRLTRGGEAVLAGSISSPACFVCPWAYGPLRNEPAC